MNYNDFWDNVLKQEEWNDEPLHKLNFLERLFYKNAFNNAMAFINPFNMAHNVMSGTIDIFIRVLRTIRKAIKELSLTIIKRFKELKKVTIQHRILIARQLRDGIDERLKTSADELKRAVARFKKDTS